MPFTPVLLNAIRASKGTDWSLNVDIARAIGWTLQSSRVESHAMCRWFDENGRFGDAPNYTGTFEGAIAALPSGATIKSIFYWSDDRMWKVVVRRPGHAPLHSSGHVENCDGDHESLCRAIILAGLAARDAQPMKQREAA